MTRAMQLITALAPQGLTPAGLEAWQDGVLSASLLFNTPAEAEVDECWKSTCHYPDYLAGRQTGALLTEVA